MPYIRVRPTVDDLTDQQRQFFNALPEELHDQFLATMPDKQKFVADTDKKEKALEEVLRRFEILKVCVDQKVDDIAQTIKDIQAGDQVAMGVDMFDVKRLDVKGFVIRMQRDGQPRAKREPKTDSEGNIVKGRRGRPKKAEAA